MKTVTFQLSFRTICLIVALYFITTIVSVVAVWELKEHWRSDGHRLVEPWTELIEGIFSSDASLDDDQLRRRYIKTAELASQISGSLASRYQLPSLDEMTGTLESIKRSLKETTDPLPPILHPRQLFGIPFLGTGATTTAPASAPTATAGANPLEQFGSALLGPLTDTFTSIGNGILGDVAGGSMFLGIGIGVGAAQGLKLAEPDKAIAVGKKVAADNGMQATGLNPAIQNLGVGAAGTILGAVNLTSLAGTADIPMGITVRSLAEGIATGAVSGLKLGKSGVVLEPPAGSGVPEIAGNFGYGLSKSFASNVNFSALMPAGKSGDMMKMLPPAAAGLGKGLGEGISIGLDLQPDSEIILATMPPGEIDTEGVTRGFARGFTSRLLANGTIGRAMAAMADPGSSLSGLTANMPKINVGSAAQGFARGFVQGAADAVESIGGVGALMNGTSHAPAGNPPNGTLVFDDSVGGAATGFGQGLGGQGVLVARQLLQGVKILPPGAAAKREAKSLAVRQGSIVSVDGSPGLNLSVFVNAQTVSFATQVGVSALSCQGVGGLFGVLAGLASSGALPTGPAEGNENATKFVKQMVPAGTIMFTNSGNTYEIDGRQVVDGLESGMMAAAGGIKINGMGATGFVALLLLHGEFVKYASLMHAC
jgi:hypothetical protein